MASDRFAPARAEASNSGPDGSASSGLVTLADLRRRRAEALQITASPEPRRARGGEGGRSGSGGAATAGAAAKKRRRKAVALSFAGDEEDEGGGAGEVLSLKDEAKTTGDKKEKPISAAMMASPSSAAGAEKGDAEREGITANTAVAAPKLRSRAALRREALEREALRQEFLALQAAVRATEIALPFVFYDGTNLSGGIVRLKKGDPVWLFLDRGRKMAAAGTAGGGFKPGVGGERMSFRARREWARVSVDDLMLVRDSVIIPPHYEFYYFILNKTVGHGGRLLFDYSNEPPPAPPPASAPAPPPPSEPEQGKGGGGGDGDGKGDGDGQEKGDGQAKGDGDGQEKPEAAEASVVKLPAPPPPISSLEGASDDPALTKIVNRRWFERNKHIFPASMWREFDPEANYAGEIRRDTGGNAFFFAK